MSVEWASAAYGFELVGPKGFTDDHGSTVDDHAILLGSDSTVVVEGSLDALESLASDLLASIQRRRVAEVADPPPPHHHRFVIELDVPVGVAEAADTEWWADAAAGACTEYGAENVVFLLEPWTEAGS